jgi:hypothetical protein
MAELKPLGSEKLQGDDKIKRILELAYYGNNPKSKPSNSSLNKVEHLSESVNGVYGIVKEKDGYYVKKGLNEGSLDYIGGLFMKNKNRFNSYAEALKRLDLLNGQELQEATKYVLKQTKKEEVTPLPSDAPSPDMGAEEVPSPESLPSDDMGAEEVPSPESLPSDDMGAEEEPTAEPKPSDYMTEIQKFSGKLGQELRDQKIKMESDDIKYVLNMIISAVDLTKLSDEDIGEIGKKFDREVEDDVELSDEVPSDEDTAEVPPADEDLGEMSMMDKLESFINSPAVQDEEIDLSKYSDLDEYEKDDIKEIDLEEIKKEINQSIESTLGKYFK